MQYVFYLRHQTVNCTFNDIAVSVIGCNIILKAIYFENLPRCDKYSCIESN